MYEFQFRCCLFEDFSYPNPKTPADKIAYLCPYSTVYALFHFHSSCLATNEDPVVQYEGIQDLSCKQHSSQN